MIFSTDASEELNSLIERIVTGKPKEYYNRLYLDMKEFIKNDVNGEGADLRNSFYYSTIWQLQTIDRD